MVTETENPNDTEMAIRSAVNGEYVKINNKTYRKDNSGKYVPHFVPEEHAKSLLESITDSHTVTGIRLSDPANPDAPGVVVTLFPGEGAKVIATIKDVLKARAKL